MTTFILSEMPGYTDQKGNYHAGRVVLDEESHGVEIATIDFTGKAKKPRTRKCAVKGCSVRFEPKSITHKACGPDCAAVIAVLDRQKKARLAAKRERMADKARKEALMTLSDWIAATQVVFNRFIRLRDAGKPCICCGRPQTQMTGLHAHGVDAGHYRSVGSAPHLRFDERNCHAQLVHCNRYGAGRAVDYRVGLIARIGLEAVEALEADQTPKHYTIADLKALKAEYQRKCKELLAAQKDMGVEG